MKKTSRKQVQVQAKGLQSSSSRCSEEMMPPYRCWSNLPMDLLLIVCGNLVEADDYLRFGAVCTTWRICLWLSRKKIPPPPPVHMFPISKCYYPLLAHKPLPIKAKQKFYKVIGSNHGWLIITDGIFGPHNSIQLLNPFSAVNNVIQLPPLLDVPNDLHVWKAVLSHNQTLTSNYVVMLMYCSDDKINFAFVKSGEKSWNHIYTTSYWSDIIYHNDQFYAISPWGLVTCDITNSVQPKLIDIMSSPVPCIIGWERSTLLYLVESSEEDLLCVQRELVSEGHDKFTVGVQRELVSEGHDKFTVGVRVFKFQTSEKQWIELMSISGQAIFITYDSSLSLQVSNFHHCKPGEIYFREHSDKVTVFNLENGSSRTLPCSHREPSVWIRPTIIMSDPHGSFMSMKHHKQSCSMQKTDISVQRDREKALRLVRRYGRDVNDRKHYSAFLILFLSYFLIYLYVCLCVSLPGV